MVSLLFNVIGSTVAGKHSLEIIRVYLTFPLGARALPLGNAECGFRVCHQRWHNSGAGLLSLHRDRHGAGKPVPLCDLPIRENKSLLARLIWGSVLGAVVWFVNYYLILSWLQPALFGGNWITNNEYLPWWVALATHLVFGWSMAVMTPFGAYVPYRRPTV